MVGACANACPKYLEGPLVTFEPEVDAALNGENEPVAWNIIGVNAQTRLLEQERRGPLGLSMSSEPRQ